MSALVHIAGPVDRFLQRCSLCGVPLSDHRIAGVDVPKGTSRLARPGCGPYPIGMRVIVADHWQAAIVQGSTSAPPCREPETVQDQNRDQIPPYPSTP